jgi:hypothetical protein
MLLQSSRVDRKEGGGVREKERGCHVVSKKAKDISQVKVEDGGIGRREIERTYQRRERIDGLQPGDKSGQPMVASRHRQSSQPRKSRRVGRSAGLDSLSFSGSAHVSTSSSREISSGSRNDKTEDDVDKEAEPYEEENEEEEEEEKEEGYVVKSYEGYEKGNEFILSIKQRKRETFVECKPDSGAHNVAPSRLSTDKDAASRRARRELPAGVGSRPEAREATSGGRRSVSGRGKDRNKGDVLEMDWANGEWPDLRVDPKMPASSSASKQPDLGTTVAELREDSTHAHINDLESLDSVGDYFDIFDVNNEGGGYDIAEDDDAAEYLEEGSDHAVGLSDDTDDDACAVARAGAFAGEPWQFMASVETGVAVTFTFSVADTLTEEVLIPPTPVAQPHACLDPGCRAFVQVGIVITC